MRFAPRHKQSEDQTREMEEERKNVVEKRKEIKAAGPAQTQPKQWREEINGNATVSRKEDPREWGTHTPVPTESEDKDLEDEANE